MASKITTNHEEIREWAEAQGGEPCGVVGTTIIRIRFPGNTSRTLRAIDWEVFFSVFEAEKLALLYDPNTRFNKLVRRP